MNPAWIVAIAAVAWLIAVTLIVAWFRAIRDRSQSDEQDF